MEGDGDEYRVGIIGDDVGNGNGIWYWVMYLFVVMISVLLLVM